MPAIMLNRITGLPIARFQVVSGQIGFEVDRWWHTRVVQRYAATAYKTATLPHPAPKMNIFSSTSYGSHIFARHSS